MISLRNTLRCTAAVCAILTAGISLAEDGVVRMSDRSSAPEAGSGVVRLAAKTKPVVQQVGFSSGDSCGAVCDEPTCCAPQIYQACPTECWTAPCDPCAAGACCPNSCDSGCNTYVASCDASGMPSCWCKDCQSSPCQCYGGRRRNGRNRDSVPLFAPHVDSGTGSAVCDCWHSQSMSFRNKNSRLSHKLFGWMVPSACVAPVGSYHRVYAHDPSYFDSRDGQLYGAQGYGMPITVPLAPNVHHTYNYSAGLPASRVTHIGNYNPVTAPAPYWHQSW
jgi:hypothetical protein